MNKVVPLFVFSAIIAASLADKGEVNGHTVLVNEYMYPIPVHNTPLRIKKTPILEEEKEVPIPHEVYGIPNEDLVIIDEAAASEHELPAKPVVAKYKYDIPATSEIIIKKEPAPGKPALVYGVPEAVVPKSEPAPGKPAIVYGAPEVVIVRLEPAPGEPAPVYGAPDLVGVEVN